MFIKLLFVTALLGASIAWATEKQPCVELVNKRLASLNFGTFSKPASGVNKMPGKGGGWSFGAPGGTSMMITDEKIDTANFAFGSTHYTTTEFDENCKITSVTVSVSSQFPGGGIYAKADKNNCTKYAITPPGMPLGFDRAMMEGLCSDNFPESLVGRPAPPVPQMPRPPGIIPVQPMPQVPGATR